MAFEFHEVLLDVNYSPNAEGGPEFGNKLFGSPDSGMEVVNVGRERARHRYTIDYNLLPAVDRANLYSFFYAIGGIKSGFRFLAPDDSVLDNELIATGNASSTQFNLTKTYAITATGYTGETVSYSRRIVKPAVGTMSVFVGASQMTLVTGVPGAGQAQIDYTTGVVKFGTAPANGAAIRVSGTFHVPVRFNTDHFNAKYDVSAEWNGIELVELLPEALGIS